MKNHYIAMDVETGGLDYQKNPITEIALVVMEPKNLTVIDKWTTFVKPYNDMEITKKSLEVSRVSMEQINKGLDYVKVIAKLIEMFRKHTPPNTKDSKPILVGHNFTFDWDFIEFIMALKNKRLKDFVDPNYYCTMKFMKMIERKQKSDLAYDLTSCCSRFGIKLKAAHGALNDTMVTADLFRMIINSINIGGESDPSDNKVIQTKQEKSRKFFEF